MRHHDPIMPDRDRPAHLLWPLAAVGAGAAAVWAYRDYSSWIALGEGGVPANPWGWLQATYFRLIQRDVYSTEPLLPMIGRPGDVATLAGLPARRGPRPRVNPQPVPSRQLDQLPAEPIRRELGQLFDATVVANDDQLMYQRGNFEKHHPAVTMRHPGVGVPAALSSHGEIAHLHPSDGAMHMTLSPSDAKSLIEAGWGRFHGLAGIAHGQPPTYVMVYAPRDEDELATVGRILDAAITYMTRRPPRPRGARPA